MSGKGASAVVTASPFPGFALAMRLNPLTPTPCDRCGQPTACLYRRWGEFDLHNLYCPRCCVSPTNTAPMAEWRLHIYQQGGEWTEPVRQTFDELRADLERVAPDEDWVYIERLVDGEWSRVAFAGFAPGLPDAWDYDPGVEQ